MEADNINGNQQSQSHQNSQSQSESQRRKFSVNLISSNWHLPSTFYFTMDVILLFLIMLFQGCILSYFLVQYHDGLSGWYFFFFADFIVILLFLFGAKFAHKHFRKLPTEIHHDEAATRLITRHGIFSCRFPAKLGTLPLLWINWILYALLFSIKIFILHNEEIAQQLGKSQEIQPHTIKLSLGCAAVIFLLWVEIHKNPHSHKSASDVITGVMFEIFDSVILLDLLMPDDNNGEQKEQVAYWLSLIIIILACVNFVLPAFNLYQLSKHNFDSSPQVTLTTNLIHHLLRIFLVNIPYLMIRVYIWKTSKQEISIFLLKNALALFVSAKSFFPELNEWLKMRKANVGDVEENQFPLASVVQESNKNDQNA